MKGYLIPFFFVVITSLSTKIPLKDCRVDSEGEYKYIQIQVSNPHNPLENKIIVRGSKEFPNHSDIYRDFMNKVEATDQRLYKSYTFKPIGGGHIQVTPPHVELFGSSGTYGKCNHVMSAEIIKSCFPDDYSIKYAPMRKDTTLDYERESPME